MLGSSTVARQVADDRDVGTRHLLDLYEAVANTTGYLVSLAYNQHGQPQLLRVDRAVGPFGAGSVTIDCALGVDRQWWFTHAFGAGRLAPAHDLATAVDQVRVLLGDRPRVANRPPKASHRRPGNARLWIGWKPAVVFLMLLGLVSFLTTTR